MGSNYSNLKSHVSSKKVPKHLRPRKQKTPSKPDVVPIKKTFVKVVVNAEDKVMTEEETILVGTGPRGAFRWFKGRRYLNYASEVKCNLYLESE